MIDELTDPALEARLRRAFDRVVPMIVADDSLETVAGSRDDETLEIDVEMRLVVRHAGRQLSLIAAAAILVVALVTASMLRDGKSRNEVDSLPAASGDLAGSAVPDWYRLVRPLIPASFEYLAFSSTSDSGDARIVAVDPTTAKTLDINLSDPGSVGLPTSTLDANAELAPGDGVTTSGMLITVRCGIGGGGADFAGATDYCNLPSTGPFGDDELRDVVDRLGALDSSILSTSNGGDRRVTHEPLVAVVRTAYPDQSVVGTLDDPAGWVTLDFGRNTLGGPADTSVRIIWGLYPTPTPTSAPTWALYNDAAAGWQFGPAGLAIRISTKDPSPSSLDHLGELSSRMLDENLIRLEAVNGTFQTTTSGVVETASFGEGTFAPLPLSNGSSLTIQIEDTAPAICALIDGELSGCDGYFPSGPLFTRTARLDDTHQLDYGTITDGYIVVATRNGETLDVTSSPDIIGGRRAFAILHDNADIVLDHTTDPIADSVSLSP